MQQTCTLMVHSLVFAPS